MKATGRALRLLGLESLPRLFDQRDDIAHPEYPPGYPLWIEFAQIVQFFAETNELDGLAGNGSHAERRAAPAVAFHPGQDDARDPDFAVEFACHIHGVLTRQTVDNEQRFVRLHGIPHRYDFVHQLVVDVEASSGVEHQDVVAVDNSLALCPQRDFDRRLARADGQGADSRLPPQNFKLLHGCGAPSIEGSHQDLFAVGFDNALRNFRRRRRLARTLQPDHQNRSGRIPDFKLGWFRLVALQRLDEFIVNDLDDLVARCNRSHHRLACRFPLR